ncbi:efflux RND transporter periplasmic adaptor subunit [Aestuariibacter sp. GS-14]|uniref:efflux RND transporter periplasmic adaptor subunit n=1 Tax=Aestuariibacter sp. GS-14 TaxID=2590670 RepID=UPI00112A8213|nr:efflux RND transporter periplasmic adaptor subunit [Aestuariibacter sp. GS-14]TPV61737.1 efflux RND transporter periplasmic adaptor subunit [Aestuariibacter sp. GS-14]
MRTLKTITTPLFLVLGLSLAQTPAHAQSWGGGNRPKLVVLNKIEFQHEQNTVQAVGTAEAIRAVTLYPAVADEVTAVNFKPGQKVNKGDVLLTLDDRRQVVAVQRAEIQLKEAERALQRLIDSQSRGAVAQSDIDLATTTRDLAKVTLNEAKADLADRSIVAPFSGFVGLTDVEVGDRITTTTPVTTLDDRSALYVNFRAPESSVDLLQSESTVELQPWSNRDISLTAKIAQLDSRISTTDRTIAARALLDNTNDQYRPGMSFRVNLTLHGERFAAIPESALLWGATGAYIYKAVEGKAKRVDVSVHQRLRGTILVSGELGEGDLLIAEGIQRLREGQEVTTSLARGNANE